MTRVLVACLSLLCAAACASPPPPVPDNVSVGPVAFSGSIEHLRAAREPIVAPNDAPPQIKGMHFNTLDLCRQARGECLDFWRGSVLTSTNVASVEVRTNLFSINVPRTDFGKFAFKVDVLDVPPIFIRDYRLRVIARNSAGVAVEEDMPFHIR
ncbi:MAG TPA: hypothetical protein VGG89_05225 [Candidatus Baltobacteraceae bacterium]|jgi:hypothetical protein